MTTYTFSSNPGSIPSFDPLTDVLVLDSANGSGDAVALGNLLITETTAGVNFTYEDQTVTLGGVTLQQLDSSTTTLGTGNVQYDGAGLLTFGDQDAATSSDAGVGPINGTAGDDYMVGGDGADDFRGGNGNDTLMGGAGADHLSGGKGNDIVVGGDGNDHIKGGSGNDYLDGGNGDDVIDESADLGVVQSTGESSAPGNNTMSGGAGDDTILGGAGNDTIGGGMGDDTLVGGAGDDTIRGGQGNDTITGGVGDDTLRGDAGADTFKFVGDGSVATGNDTIQDFVHGTDHISLTDASGAQLTGAALTTAVQDALDNFSVSGGNGKVALANGLVTLTGVTSIDASDFSGVTLPAVSINDPAAQTEGNTFDFTVSLDAASDFVTTVNYTDSNGMSGSIDIAAGATTGDIFVSSSNDTNAFGDTGVSVTINSVTNATIADNFGSSTALDDDSNPSLTNLTSTASGGAQHIIDSSVTVSSGNTDGSAAGWNGGTLVVSTSDGNNNFDIDTSGAIQVLGGTNNSGSLVIVNGNLVGTITNDFTDSYGQIQFNSDATDADIQALVEAIELTNNNGYSSSSSVYVTLTNATGNSTTDTVTVTTTAATPLAITNLDGDSSLVQRIDPAKVLDQDGAASQNVITSVGTASGTTISVAITSGGDALDKLTLDGNNSFGSDGIYNGKYVVVNNTIIGTITSGAADSNAFTVTLNGNGSDGDINQFLRELTFDTQTGAADGERDITITMTASDGQTATADVSVSVAGHIFELTTADDTGAGFTGDAGVDVFSGANGVSAAAGTLNDGDVLNGGGGTNDRLIASLGDGSGNGNTVTPTITGVNFFQITSSQGDASSTNELDFSNITGVTNVAIQHDGTNGDQDLTLTAVSASVTTINASTFDANLDVTFNAGSGSVNLMSGSGNDQFDFGATLDNGDTVNGGSGSDTLTATVSAGVTPNVANVEEIDLTATADLTVNAASITGAAGDTNLALDDGAGTDIDVTVTNVGSAIGSIDGSGLNDAASSLTVSVAGRATGIDITGSAGDDSITGGDGNDSISGGTGNDTITTGAGTDSVDGGAGNDTINDADLTTADTINGGANTDTLNGTIAASYAPDAGHLTGVENVNLTVTGDYAVDLSAQAAVAAVTLSDGALTDIDVTFNGNGAGLTSLDAHLLDGTGSSLTFTATTPTDLTLTGSAGDDTLNFGTTLDGNDTIDGGNGTDTLTATIGAGGYNPAASHLMNVETLSFTGSADSTIDLTNVTGAHTVQLSDGAVADIDITLTGLASSITTVDATNLNDAASSLNVTFANAADMTVTGSAGNDTFDFGTTFDANDVVHAGTGTDTLIADFGMGGSFTAASGNLTSVDDLQFTVGASGTVNLANAAGTTSLDLTASAINVASTVTVGDDQTDVVLHDGGFANNDVTVNGITAASDLDNVDASNLTVATDSLTIDATLSAANMTITGSAGADSITGGTGNDTITGNGGADSLAGGTGSDTFVYTTSYSGGVANDAATSIAALSEQSGTTGSTRDTISGFSIGDDKIDLSQFAGIVGDNDAHSFVFIGTNAFTADTVDADGAGADDGSAGLVRYANNGGNTLIQIDVNHDGTADASITLTGVYTLANTDFVGVA